MALKTLNLEIEKKYWSKGKNLIAGVDEAGRGPLAGPVVAAAVILPKNFLNSEIKDSKKLTPKKRQYLYELLYNDAVAIGVGIVDNIRIDYMNILQASLLSMNIAVESLNIQPDYLLIDGIYKIKSDIPQQTVIKGDSLSLSIASASIIAKVTRDGIMQRHHKQYTQYSFD